MDLVVDANVFFSALIRRAGTCDLFFSDELKLFAPEFVLEEFEKHKGEILSKSKVSGEDLALVVAIVSSRIRFIPFEEFRSFLPKSKEVCPDENDVEYFALAFKLGCPLWSNDKVLKDQRVIRVLSTSELLGLLRG